MVLLKVPKKVLPKKNVTKSARKIAQNSGVRLKVPEKFNNMFKNCSLKSAKECAYKKQDNDKNDPRKCPKKSN